MSPGTLIGTRDRPVVDPGHSMRQYAQRQGIGIIFDGIGPYPVSRELLPSIPGRPGRYVRAGRGIATNVTEPLASESAPEYM